MSSAVSHSRHDDGELIRRIEAGRQDALEELFGRYGSMLLGLAQRVLFRREEAEEVIQDVFTHVWKNASSYDPGRSSVSTWLVLVTRSRAIDRLRSGKVVDRTLAAVQAQNPSQHTSPRGIENVLSSERRRRVREEMDKLPAEQAQVLDLAFFRGLTQSEIAARTGIPLGTVKTRTLLAMRKLRTALAAEVEELL